MMNHHLSMNHWFAIILAIIQHHFTIINHPFINHPKPLFIYEPLTIASPLISHHSTITNHHSNHHSPLTSHYQPWITIISTIPSTTSGSPPIGSLAGAEESFPRIEPCDLDLLLVPAVALDLARRRAWVGWGLSKVVKIIRSNDGDMPTQ